MQDGYPYPRFLRLELSPWQEVRSQFSVWRFRISQTWDTARLRFLQATGFYDRKQYPFTKYLEYARMPMCNGRGFGARTQHGEAVVKWSLTTGYEKFDTRGWRAVTSARPLSAHNVLLPDGTRGSANSCIGDKWRRPALSPGLWTWGDVAISADDVVFKDSVWQPLYTGPSEDACLLERELAGCKPFVEALEDAEFATVACDLLKNCEWLKIGVQGGSEWSSGCIAGFVAELRGKGEYYLDYKYGGHPVAKSRQSAHARRMIEILHSLGWRTYTSDELSAMAKDAFLARIDRRYAAWNALTALEARATGTHSVLDVNLLVDDILLYEVEDPLWLDDLGEARRAATTAEFPRRVLALARDGKITMAEYNDLRDALL